MLRPVGAVDVVTRVADGVVRSHGSVGDSGQAGAFDCPPGRGVGSGHGYEHGRRVRVGLPGVLDGFGDEAGAEAAITQGALADQLVDLDGAGRHLNQAGELGQVLGVVMDPGALEESDRLAVVEHDEVFSRFVASHTWSEVARSTLAIEASWCHQRATCGSASFGSSAATSGRQVRSPVSAPTTTRSSHGWRRPRAEAGRRRRRALVDVSYVGGDEPVHQQAVDRVENEGGKAGGIDVCRNLAEGIGQPRQPGLARPRCAADHRAGSRMDQAQSSYIVLAPAASDG